METNVHSEKQVIETKLLQDMHKDEYWAKKYDISADELSETENIDLSTLIIKAGIKRNSFQSITA
jgi:hypothetical protein